MAKVAFLIVWLAGVLCLCAPVAAATPAVLVGLDLQAKAVHIQGLSGGALSYFDRDRRLRVEPIDTVVQIREIGLPSRSGSVDADVAVVDGVGVIELVDGQRLTGEWVDAQAGVVRWRHPWLGLVGIGLDRIARVSLSGPLAVEAGDPPTSDWVALANGDRVSGYVVELSDGGLDFQPEDGGDVITIPMKHVRALRLANPVRRWGGADTVVWLRDSSRVRVDEIEILSDRASMRLSLGSAVSVEMDRISRIDFASQRGYLVDVADLPMRRVGGGDVFGLNMGPRVVGGAIGLHAPMRVRIDLPEGAQRLAATVALDPVSAWADCGVSVWSGSEMVYRSRLHAEHPVDSFNVGLNGSGFVIVEVDVANNGPVMDRVLLRHAVLLVGVAGGGD